MECRSLWCKPKAHKHDIKIEQSEILFLTPYCHYYGDICIIYLQGQIVCFVCTPICYPFDSVELFNKAKKGRETGWNGERTIYFVHQITWRYWVFLLRNLLTPFFIELKCKKCCWKAIALTEMFSFGVSTPAFSQLWSLDIRLKELLLMYQKCHTCHRSQLNIVIFISPS